MISHYLKNWKRKNYRNAIDANYFAKKIKILTGFAVVTMECDSNNRIVTKFRLWGFVSYIIWLVVYFYLSYITFCEDQTILRSLYNTQLKHYGDVFERFVSIVYAVYAMWKVPFNMSLNYGYVQEILDIDRATFRVTFVSAMLQIVVSAARLSTVWITLKNVETHIPIEVMVRVAFYDAVVMVTSSHYYIYLILLKDRYNMINKLLRDIKERKAWEYTMYVRSKPSTYEKTDELQGKYVCEKIKDCAKIYSMLYKAHRTAKLMFGFALLLTMLFCLLYIILYLFYFMEATASGLFHDTRRYVYFLIYVFWQIAYSLGVIYFSIYFSEATVKEVRLQFFIQESMCFHD